MCLTSDAVYRIRDADAIFRIERKDDQKIAQNTKLFYRNYFEFTTNTSGRVCGTLWRIVSNYILFFCAWFSRFTEGTCRTRRITLREPRKITTDHDMRPIRLIGCEDIGHISSHLKKLTHPTPGQWRGQGGARGAMAPPKLLVNVFFLQLISGNLEVTRKCQKKFPELR